MTKEVRHDNSCRFRLYPNKEQRELVAKTFGCCRWVYNWRLAMRKKAWEEKKSLSITDIQSRLPAMKKDAAIKKDELAKFLFPLLIAITVTSMLFYIDEGFYNFKWMLNIGNWIAFIIYIAAIYILQLIFVLPLYKLAPRFIIDSGKIFLALTIVFHLLLIIVL